MNAPYLSPPRLLWRLLLLVALGMVADPSARAGLGTAADDPHQIEWIGDLDAARAIAAAQQRPLLVVVNMDGESACERIVREKYRDPAFVALTRRAVCVSASAFRHTPRDYDDAGLPIACPRLGVITCGEHIALEPLLFDAYLGGERIAPRHAVIRPDGSKAFDLFLLFDLDALDRTLAESLADWPDPRPHAGLPDSPLATWRKLAARSTTAAALAQLVGSARELGIAEAAAAEIARIAIEVHEVPPAMPRRELMPALAGLSHAPWVVSRVLADRVLGAAAGRDVAMRALVAAVGADAAGGIEAMLARRGECDGHALLAFAAQVQREVGIDPAPPRPVADEAELLTRLDAATREPKDPRTEAEVAARIGRASLELARLRIDGGEPGGDVFLVDAARYLARARELQPEDVTLWCDSAKAAYLAGQFADQEMFAIAAQRALGNAPGPGGAPLAEVAAALAEPRRHEVLRWVGDAAARLLGARSGGDASLEALAIRRGGEALMLAAASPRADEVDMQSVAAFFAALGQVHLELGWLDLGLQRFPESNLLRSAINATLWRIGRPALAVEHADRLAREHDDCGACGWYAGFARILLGDWRRREEAADAALALYRAADRDFQRCADQAPDFAPSCAWYRARCALSRGFSHLLVDRQGEAAACLVEGVELDASVVLARDGVDREGLDLVDGVLEWRAGRESPVAPDALLRDVLRVDPGNAYWPRAIADSQLREALRAEGRGDAALRDEYLRRSLRAGREALSLADDADSRHVLAQTATIFAERLIDRGQADPARELLAIAAPLLDMRAPTRSATLDDLRGLAAALRGELGEPRPIDRPGR